MMTKIFPLLLPAIFVCITSCNVQTATLNNSASNTVEKPVENKIIYLFFEIEKQDGSTEKVTLTETKSTQGFVKNGGIDNKPSIPGNLLISLLGNNGEVMEERIIEDPLNPVLEVYAEEGLSKNKLKLQKAQFSVRFNQKGEISNVKVEKITSNSKTTLISLKL